jgi:DsbC/DsbD-like thiol-disulfide interchange protein
MTGMKKTGFLLSALLGAALSGPASASSSDWFKTDGASVRLITTGAPDAEGRLRGILDIALEPGWKTYWRDPGDAGVPPSVDLKASTNVVAAELAFPPPQRHDEGDFKWAGYDYPIALPVTFRMNAPGEPAMIDAEIFLGVCETICVPVKATITLDPASDPDNPDDAAAVAAAEATLPGPARPDFGVKLAGGLADRPIVLEAVFPGDPQSAELFIAGDEGYSFTTPERSEKDGKTLFSTEVSLPARVGTGSGLHYTLVTSAGAVSGLLPYF